MPDKIKVVMYEVNPALVKRFWGNVHKTESCWRWTAGRFRSGYGQFRAGNKKVRAHRYSFLLSNGEIPESKIICHTCDNKVCVNPEHLYAGTHADNCRDREARTTYQHGPKKGFGLSGETNPAAKLNAILVTKIRSLRNKGRTYSELSDIFGVSKSLIAAIARGEIWQMAQK